MRGAIHTRTWLLALVCLSALGGCRRETTIWFHTEVMPPPEIDQVIVDLHGIGMKRSVQLNAMDWMIVLFNLPGDQIQITAYGCSQKVIKLINEHPYPDSYSTASDDVPVTMVPFTGDSSTPCPKVESDGGVSGEPTDAGAGGDTGAGGYGSGGTAGTGVGGMSFGGGGAGGGVDAAGGAGAGGTSGSGGNTGAGGCDDAGHGSVDAAICDQPPDPVQNATPLQPTSVCVDYCNQIIGTPDGGTPLCPGAYESIDQCQHYCTRRAWDTVVSGTMNDDMPCRMLALTLARANDPLSPTRADYCTSAGPAGGATPTGGAGNMCGNGSGGACGTFCNAWAKFCPDGATVAACMTACQASPSSSEPTCRFRWLLRAATDPRYCAVIDYAASCVPSGC